MRPTPGPTPAQSCGSGHDPCRADVRHLACGRRPAHLAEALYQRCLIWGRRSSSTPRWSRSDGRRRRDRRPDPGRVDSGRRRRGGDADARTVYGTLLQDRRTRGPLQRLCQDAALFSGFVLLLAVDGQTPASATTTSGSRRTTTPSSTSCSARTRPRSVIRRSTPVCPTTRRCVPTARSPGSSLSTRLPRIRRHGLVGGPRTTPIMCWLSWPSGCRSAREDPVAPDTHA